jgi:hypothetical protein
MLMGEMGPDQQLYTWYFNNYHIKEQKKKKARKITSSKDYVKNVKKPIKN